jgi:hypothetical protein
VSKIARRVAARILLARRVAVRYVERQADQTPDARREVRKLTQPINKPVNVTRTIQRQEGKEEPPPEAPKPHRRDIKPKDVFTPTPNQVGVRNFVETGRETGDQGKIEKGTGFATVKNLSQYLIKTQGGGDTPPQGRK